jgi:hypothetical protein
MELNCRQFTSWTRHQTTDAFLVLDRDRNGTIDSGREMFGNATPLMLSAALASHGYEALSEFDDARLGGNGNGLIDAEDAIFEHLRLWFDGNRDGISQAHELVDLESVGLASIDLLIFEDGRVDQWGNELRWRSKIFFGDGSTSEAGTCFSRDRESSSTSKLHYAMRMLAGCLFAVYLLGCSAFGGDDRYCSRFNAGSSLEPLVEVYLRWPVEATELSLHFDESGWVRMSGVSSRVPSLFSGFYCETLSPAEASSLRSAWRRVPPAHQSARFSSTVSAVFTFESEVFRRTRTHIGRGLDGRNATW